MKNHQEIAPFDSAPSMDAQALRMRLEEDSAATQNLKRGDRQRWNGPRIQAILLLGLIGLPFCTADAQTDLVERSGARAVRGTVASVNRNGVVVDANGSNTVVDAKEIRRVNFGQIEDDSRRAITLFNEKRYTDCLDAISKIKSAPRNKFVAAEIAYCKAMSLANDALGGGSTSMTDAENALSAFVRLYPNSYHYYPLAETLAQVLMAAGKANEGKALYAEIAKSNWPEKKLAAEIALGLLDLHGGDRNSAAGHFQSAMAVDSNDDTAAPWKIVARCRLAQAEAVGGDPATGIAKIQEIIKNESGENALVFSHAYNALGHCHLKAGEAEQALLAFLHTQLLFQSIPDTHSEALFYLRDLWNSMNHPDRARDVQNSLRNNYRNTYFGAKSLSAN